MINIEGIHLVAQSQQPQPTRFYTVARVGPEIGGRVVPIAHKITDSIRGAQEYAIDDFLRIWYVAMGMQNPQHMVSNIATQIQRVLCSTKIT